MAATKVSYLIKVTQVRDEGEIITDYISNLLYTIINLIYNQFS